MKYTRVGTVISVGHNSPEGVAHGHSYEIWATYRFGHDARALLRQLETATKPLDHTVLPDDISLGENLAEHIGKQLPGCIRVECNRPLERWGATWEPDALAAAASGGDVKQAPAIRVTVRAREQRQ